jgi:hypothetical protein
MELLVRQVLLDLLEQTVQQALQDLQVRQVLQVQPLL